jgi:hypothetical protein
MTGVVDDGEEEVVEEQRQEHFSYESCKAGWLFRKLSSWVYEVKSSKRDDVEKNFLLPACLGHFAITPGELITACGTSVHHEHTIVMYSLC